MHPSAIQDTTRRSGGRGLLIVGCGYSGQEIARVAVERGWLVWGTSRTEDRFAAIREAGAEPLIWTPGDALPAALQTQVDSVVDCVGPPWSDAPDPTPAVVEATRSLASAAFVYLSSTSVYGDFRGEWVDEHTPCAPTSAAGQRRWEAEELLRAQHRDTGLPIRICRLPGIYGPGRSVLDRIRSGRFRIVDGHVPYSNRIHVRDLARGVVAAIEAGRPGETYLLADGNPDRLDAIGAFAAGLLGVEPPAAKSADQIRAEAHPNAWAMLTDSKRLANRRMREELGVEPEFPSFREGLRAVLASERGDG